MEPIQVQETNGQELPVQELQQIRETQEVAESIDLAVLRLNSDDNHHHNPYSHTPCQSCGCAGGPSSVLSSSRNNKRRSPEVGSLSTPPLSPAAVVESPERDSRFQLSKRPKKLFFESSPETIAGVVIPPGFSKIALPVSPQLVSTPPPAGSPVAAAAAAAAASPSPNLRCPPPTRNIFPNDSSTPLSKAAGSSSRPPLPPLRRSWSLPSPEKPVPSSCNGAVLANPQHHGEKLKAVGDWIKEVAKWWDEFRTVDEIEPVVIQEEKKCSNDDGDDDAPKDATESGCEESVNVERTGECLIINFKCPCKKGYQILLSGTSCYYKLV